MVQTYHNFQGAASSNPLNWVWLRAWFQQYWLVVLLVSVVKYTWQYSCCFIRWGSIVQAEWDCGKLCKVPVAGSLYRQYWFVQFIQALGLLLSGGMLLVDCFICYSEMVLQTKFVCGRRQQLADEVAAGVPFWQAMERCSLFPAAARQVLVVSEQTGRLALAAAQLSFSIMSSSAAAVTNGGKTRWSLGVFIIVLLGGMVLVLAGSHFTAGG